jgi:hypothetical protein
MDRQRGCFLSILAILVAASPPGNGGSSYRTVIRPYETGPELGEALREDSMQEREEEISRGWRAYREALAGHLEGASGPASRLRAALQLTPEEYGDIILRGDDPTLALAIPLAVALEEAKRAHQPRSKPLPLHVIRYLEKHYPAAVVRASRYSIGDVEISLPSAINVFNPGTAVTLPGLIVFPSEPDWADVVMRHWWAHEAQHLRQYELLGGTLEFAWAYLNYCVSLESEADQHADETLQANGDRPPPHTHHCQL